MLHPAQSRTHDMADSFSNRESGGGGAWSDSPSTRYGSRDQVTESNLSLDPNQPFALTPNQGGMERPDLEATHLARRPAVTGYSLPQPTLPEVPRAGDGLSPSLSTVQGAHPPQSPQSSMYTYSGPVQSAWTTNPSYSVGNSHHNSNYSSHQHGLPALAHLQPSHHQQQHHTPQHQHSQIQHHNPHQGQQHHSSLYATRQHSMYSQSPLALNYTASQRSSSQSPPQQPGFQHFMSHSGPIQPLPTTSGPSVASGPGPGSMVMPLRPIASMAPHQNSQPVTEPPHQNMGSTAMPYRGFSTYHHSMQSGLGGTGMPGMHHASNPMPVMSNMSMYAQGAAGSYGFTSHHPDRNSQSQAERPFKCDECTQSFSRNHDLKRHKRIHLSVKPYPCNYCSKSFSRKDALKRHRLVKGCENKFKNGTMGTTVDARTSHSVSDGGRP